MGRKACREQLEQQVLQVQQVRLAPQASLVPQALLEHLVNKALRVLLDKLGYKVPQVRRGQQVTLVVLV